VTINDQPPVRRRRNRRPALLQVAEIETLISAARAPRLKLVELAALEPLSEPAKEGIEAQSKVGMQLERIIELITSAKPRSRRRRTISNKP
jgi:hypothetical protein